VSTGALEANPGQDYRTLVSGRRIRLRRVQMLAWSVIAGFIGAGFVAGLYFGILEVSWHVWIGPVHFRIFYLKPWWDSLIRSGNWPLYRHVAFRDIPEPAFAVMAVRTLLAKPKYWDKPVGTVRLITAPVILIALTFALGVAGVWLLDFGGPDAWHRLFGGQRVDVAFLGKLSVGQLLLGFAIGQVLHRFWAPVGATLQGYQIQRAVAAARKRGRVPLWVRLPLAPPVIRERFSKVWRDGSRYRKVPGAHRRVLAAMSLFFVLLTILGFIGHYWVGNGHSIPYLAP
jgi:hypothetical protein